MKRNKFDVVVAGHICFDVIPKFEGEFKDFFKVFAPGKLIVCGDAATSTGGPVSNTGIALLKLGVRTGFMGKIGNDFFGNAILDRLKEIGVEKSMTIVKDSSTSYTLAIAPPKIDRIFIHHPGANNTFGVSDVNYEVVKNTNIFHLGYPPLMRKLYENNGKELTEIFKKAKSVGVTTSLDMALPDPTAPSGQVDWDKVLKNTLPYVDIYLPSAEETLYMLNKDKFFAKKNEAGAKDMLDVFRTEEVVNLAEQLLKYGSKIVVMKCGYKGMYIRTADKSAFKDFGPAKPVDLNNWSNRELWEPSFHVEKVASATGSGDSAIAGFFSAFVRGKSIEDCIRYGCMVGAHNVAVYDAVSGIKSWEETTDDINSGWKKNPLEIMSDGWKFDSNRRFWIGPKDSILK